MQLDWMDFSALGRLMRSAILCSPLLFCLACSSASSSGSNPITNPPPVNAQTTYSNASLSGTYSISTGIYSGASNSSSQTGVQAIAGTLQFDGNGNVTGGTIQFPVSGFPASDPRIYTINGTYSVSSSASGTATLAFTQTAGSTTSGMVPYLKPGSYSFTLQAAQQGASVILAESDEAAYINSIVALKQ